MWTLLNIVEGELHFELLASTEEYTLTLEVVDSFPQVTSPSRYRRTAS